MFKGFILGFVSALALVLIAVIMIKAEPFKVIDINDPKFDPYKFSFKDYDGQQKLEIYRKLFAVGVDRGFVDYIFINRGNAKVYHKGDRVSLYTVPAPEHHKGVWMWDGGHLNYQAIYDKNNKLLNLKTPPTFEYLYPDQITEDDLKDSNQQQ